MQSVTSPSWQGFYLFGSRLFTHITCWIIFYIVYSLTWATEKGLVASFHMEFILLPIRIAAVYSAVYFFLPKLLIGNRAWLWLFGYVAFITLCAVGQRLSLYGFYEPFILEQSNSLFAPKEVFRAALLVNTTVILAVCLKLFGMYKTLNNGNHAASSPTVNIKADRRTHKLRESDILYVKGMGNYVSYFLIDGTKLNTYTSMKATMHLLSQKFVKVHKSYLVNKDHIGSFNAENVQVNSHTIPRGAGLSDEQLV
ncbi:MAG: LytTR family DNA-binding domain-containing protein [Pseudomonadota bacterium]